MDNNEKIISTEEVLYYLSFAIISFTKAIGLDEGAFLFRICLLIGICLLGFKFLVGKYSLREFVSAFFLGAWGIGTVLVTGSLGMFIYVLLIIGMKNVSVRRVFLVGAVVWGMGMFVTAAASVFCGRVGVRLVHEKLGMGPLLRESLGYTHPNVLHITYVVLMALVLYLCNRQQGKKLAHTIGLLMLGNFYVFIYSMSYTGMLISFIYFAFFIYFTFRSRITQAEKFMISCIVPMLLLVSVIFPVVLKEGVFFKTINHILNSRVWAIRVFFSRYPLTLFGMSSEGMDFSIDNSYVSALMGYGVIPWCGIMAAYFFLIREYIKSEKRQELIILCTFLFAGLSEPFLFNSSVKNITVIFLGELLYEKLGGREEILYCRIMENRKFILPKFSYRKVRIKYIEVWMITIFFILFLVRSVTEDWKIAAVYVDEGLCDCRGETVLLPNDIIEEETLVIGERQSDVNYYFFSRENSKLIDVMKFRGDVSVAAYGTVVIAGILFLARWIYDKVNMKVKD